MVPRFALEQEPSQQERQQKSRIGRPEAERKLTFLTSFLFPIEYSDGEPAKLRLS